MRPYLAVLKDSFREAFASRVLWLMLVLIALFLLAIAPLGFDRGLSSQIQREELVDAMGLIKKLKKDAAADKPSPGKHLWSKLSADFRTKADKLIDTKDTDWRTRMQLTRYFQSELNKQIKSADFYDQASWANQPMDRELRNKLSAEGRTGVKDVDTVNRHALETAFDEYVSLGDDNAVFLSYAGFRVVDAALPLSAEEQQDAVKDIINGALYFLLGVFGIFISILVTASFIPRTFEPGEITLLLSKPVSRPFLFLTKFLGGCAFTLLNATFLLVGFWLIAGLRFDVWNHKLLWCIPVYVFVFAIYYAVSAGTGAIWRNAIVSVVMTILFWAAITGLGFTKGIVEELALNSTRVTEIIPTDEGLLTATAGQETQTWNGEQWDPVFARRGNGPPAFARRFAFADNRFRPVFDATNAQLVAMQAAPGRGGATQVVIGKRAEGWNRQDAGVTPTAVDSIFVDSKGRVLLVGPFAIFHFADETKPNPSDSAKPDKDTQKIREFLKKKTKGLMDFGAAAGKFQNLRPQKLPRWKSPASYAYDRSTDRLAVYSDGAIQIFQVDDTGRFELKIEKALDNKDKAIVGIAGERLLLVNENGTATTFSAATLEQTGQQTAFIDDEAPKLVEASPDGRWLAVLSHDKNVWLYDVETDQPVDWQLPGQGDISAVAFNGNNSLMIADRLTRVRTINTDQGNTTDEMSPPTTLTYKVYSYFVYPLYTVLPKPGELGNLITWLTTEKDSVALGEDPNNASLQTERIKVDIWTPIWSNVAFLIVVLGATCLYISRHDF